MTTKEYNQCVDLYADKTYGFILKNIRDKELANDIVQEAFLRLWESVSSVGFEKAKSWLFSTAYRYMIDLIRREKVKCNWEEIQTLSIAHSQQYDDLAEVLDAALKRLPEIQRSLVLLRDYEGYSYKEIGEITELKESQVKVYIFRARKTLKDYLVNMEALIDG